MPEFITRPLLIAISTFFLAGCTIVSPSAAPSTREFLPKYFCPDSGLFFGLQADGLWGFWQNTYYVPPLGPGLPAEYNTTDCSDVSYFCLAFVDRSAPRQFRLVVPRMMTAILEETVHDVAVRSRVLERWKNTEVFFVDLRQELRGRLASISLLVEPGRGVISMHGIPARSDDARSDGSCVIVSPDGLFSAVQAFEEGPPVKYVD